MSITELKIKGVNKEIEQNIVAFIGSEEFNCNELKVPSNAYSDNITKKITQAIYPYGYYNPVVIIKNDLITEDCLKINIVIELGKPLLIRKLDLKLIGKNEFKHYFEKFILKSNLKVEKILKQSEYKTLKFDLIDHASELGFLDAKFSTNKIDIYPDENTADISLHFEFGERYKIENIDIVQESDILDIEFIKNMISINPNEYFNKTLLNENRKKLKSTGYFNQVLFNLDVSVKNNNKVPLKIILTAADRIKYSTGIGFSTDTGGRVSFDYKHQRVTDYGYQFNSMLTVSEIISEFTSGLKIPAKSGALNKWSNVDLGYRIERSDNINSNTIKLGFSQTRVHHNKWQNINYIDLLNESFETGVVKTESNLIVPGSSWTYLNSDDLVLPKNGFKVQSDIKGASSSIYSDLTFLQLSFSYKGIRSFSDRHRILYRADLGTTYTSDFDLLPTSYRFYAGGDKSIRGYGYQELGPDNEDGDIIGGKNLFVTSFEYEYRLKGAWAAAIFADVGNAFNDEFKLEKSVGAGVRWISPVGPIRLDVGFPINNENDFKIHITLGPDL